MIWKGEDHRSVIREYGAQGAGLMEQGVGVLPHSKLQRVGIPRSGITLGG